MDYRKVFYDKTTEELKELLLGHNQMNLEAKYALKGIIEDKQLEVDSNLWSDMISELEEEYSKVSNLEYAENLGYKITMDDDSVLIERSMSFKISSFVGVLVGLIMCGFIILATDHWKQVFGDSSGVIEVVMSLTYSALGGFGVFLMLKCLYRIMENWDFRVEKRDGLIKVFNPFNSSLNQLEGTKDDLEFRSDKKASVILFKQQGEEVEIIRTEGGQTHRATLRKIYDLLV